METFQTIDEAFSHIESLTNFEKKPPTEIREYRLSRMKTLFGLFGDPHLRIPSVHIAGTKGKGSAAHLLASVCMEAGLKTGLYTSPHILSYKERFTVNKSEASDSLLLGIINGIYARLEKATLPVQSGPTTFEILTLVGFLLFEEEGCDCNIIETGLGGRLDATNLVDPICSVIMPIELEHTNILGDTISKIAFEKAGIIKEGKPVFVGPQYSEASDVIVSAASGKGSPVYLFDQYCSDDPDGSFRIRIPGQGYKTFLQSEHLPGKVQKENAAVAAMSGYYILQQLLPESSTDERMHWLGNGIRHTRIPARFECYTADNRTIVIDGAHTVASIRSITETFVSIYGRSCVCLFGMVEGKDIRGASRYISDSFASVIVTQPGSFKKSDIQGIYDILNESGASADIQIEADGEKALDLALRMSDSPICVTGSFYLAGVIAKICRRRGYGNV